MVVDDAARLLDHGAADLGDRGGPAQPRRRSLQHAELCGPGLRLLEEFGVRQGDRRVRGERRDEGDVAARPVVRLAGDRRKRPDDAVMVDGRRDEVAGELQDAGVALVAMTRVVACIGVGQHAPGPQDLADPALVAVERRQPGRHVVRQASPRGDLEAVVLEDPDRRHVRAEDSLRLVHDRPEQFLPVVRGRQALGDAEDRVEALGELRLQRHGGPLLRSRAGSDPDGRGRCAGRSVPLALVRAEQALPDGRADVDHAIPGPHPGAALPPVGLGRADTQRLTCAHTVRCSHPGPARASPSSVRGRWRGSPMSTVVGRRRSEPVRGFHAPGSGGRGRTSGLQDPRRATP